MARKEKLLGLEDALQAVRDGCRLAIGGFQLTSRPMALLRALVRRGVRGLTVVSPPSGLDVDLLVAAGCVRALITPYVGGETLIGIGPAFRRAVERGELEVIDYDTGMFTAGLKAAIQGLPFMPWRGGVGTSLPQVNPHIKVFQDPLEGQPLVAVPPIRVDVALIHAAYADRYGNVQHVGSPMMDRLLASAAERVVVEVERLVGNERVRAEPHRTTIPAHRVTGVVLAPYGAHPTSSPGFYVIDREHLAGEYIPAAQALYRGDGEPMKRYMERYVLGPRDHVEYLQEIGLRRLLSLSEEG
jgi:glutaconate CoA-transferase subunit A